jgi:aspartyl-tRNA synthetase
MAVLLFIDLRDHYGMTQIVASTPDSAAFKTAEDGARRMGDPRRWRGEAHSEEP